MVTSVSRGIYKIDKNQFTEKLHDAYITQLVQMIGKELYLLTKDLDKVSFEELDRRFSTLVENWEPILEKYYPLKTSSLSGHILSKV